MNLPSVLLLGAGNVAAFLGCYATLFAHKAADQLQV